MVLSSLLVVFSTNPVESVLYLILTFCNAGATLFLYNLEFFGLIFIIIYVGAIAVLFLFVIMMLNIKVRSSFLGSLNFKNGILHIVAILVIYNLLGAICLYLIKAVPFLYTKTPLDINSISSTYLLFDDLNNIDVLGQVFYNYYPLYLPLAGFILLIALVGVITLTLHFNKPKKTQLDSRQLSRSDSFISFFDNRSN
jgi:NADH-quinone oxidoreductase subunit J